MKHLCEPVGKSGPELVALLPRMQIGGNHREELPVVAILQQSHHRLQLIAEIFHCLRFHAQVVDTEHVEIAHPLKLLAVVGQLHDVYGLENLERWFPLLTHQLSEHPLVVQEVHGPAKRIEHYRLSPAVVAADIEPERRRRRRYKLCHPDNVVDRVAVKRALHVPIVHLRLVKPGQDIDGGPAVYRPPKTTVGHRRILDQTPKRSYGFEVDLRLLRPLLLVYSFHFVSVYCLRLVSLS